MAVARSLALVLALTFLSSPALLAVAEDPALPEIPDLGPVPLPGQGQSLLVGTGVLTVTRGGTSAECGDKTSMFVEGSWKPANLPPAVTINYGGGSGEGAMLLPCSVGQRLNPHVAAIWGDFDGRWGFDADYEAQDWHLLVHAPDGGAGRLVELTVIRANGDTDQFEGRLFELL